MTDKPLLRIYAQDTYHGPARIIGTPDGLRHLANALNRAADGDEDAITYTACPEDGAAYELTVTALCKEKLTLEPSHYAERQAINPWLMMIIRPALLAAGVFTAIYVVLQISGNG